MSTNASTDGTKTTVSATPRQRWGHSHGRGRSALVAATAGILFAAALITATAGVAPPAQAAPAPIPGPMPIPQAAPANGQIAFSGSTSMSGHDVYVMDPDGSNMTTLSGSSYWNFYASWSPSGETIAFTYANVLGGEPSYAAIMNADGTGFHQLSPTPKAAWAPTWSPTGSWLAFGADGALYKIRSVGTGQYMLLSSNAEMPAWSPDDTRIAVVRKLPPNDTRQIVLIDTNGANPTQITTSTTDYPGAWHPAWSPDGTRIAYTRDTAAGDTEIWVMNADGSGATRLATNGYAPEWSPTGALVLFTRVTSPYVVPLTGGPATMLPHWIEDWPAGVTWRSLTSFDWQPVVKLALPNHTTGLVDPATGVWYLYDAGGVLATSFFFGNPGDYPFMGDWDGDGVETPGLYRQSDGYVYLRNSNTQGPADINFFFGNPGDVPIAGDFNGDGFDTVSIYRPSNQTFYIINELGSADEGLGAADFSYVFGDPGDKPFVGDFNGNGEETVGLHRETTGLVYYRNTHTTGNADNQFLFGDPGDRLIAGDWNDNGTFTPALFRPSDTTMYFRYTNSQGNADNEHIPIPTHANWLPVSGHTGE